MPDSVALLPTPAAAAYLGVAGQTLRKWRCAGTGPAYVRLGHGGAARAAYRRADLDAWIAERTFASTSAETVARQGGAHVRR